MIKDNMSSLEAEEEKLFGKEFQKQLSSATEDSKSTIAYFENITKLKKKPESTAPKPKPKPSKPRGSGN